MWEHVLVGVAEMGTVREVVTGLVWVGTGGDRMDGGVVVNDGVLAASVEEGDGDAVWQPSCVVRLLFQINRLEVATVDTGKASDELSWDTFP